MGGKTEVSKDNVMNQANLMRVKWAVGSKQTMRRQVDEHEEATRIRITTRSGENAWHRVQIINKVLNMKYVWMNNKQETRKRQERKYNECLAILSIYLYCFRYQDGG